MQKDYAYLNSIDLAGVSTLQETTAYVYFFKVQYHFRPTSIRTFFENMDPTAIEHLTMNNEVRIQMEISNHILEDSILNIIMLRFPILIQDIFEELDDRSLTNCKIASKSWCEFIDDNKFPFIRKIREYRRNMEEFKIHWNKVVIRTPFEIVKELAIAVHQCFRWSITFKGGKKQWSPLHIAAERGHLQCCLSKSIPNFLKYCIKMEDKNPRNDVGLTPCHIATGEDMNPRKDIGTTPLQNAAYQSHLKICQYTIKIMEDKNPKATVKQLHFINVTSKYHLKYGG